MSAGIVLLLILALLLVIFTLQNSMLIDLKLLFWEIADVPLVLALIIAVIAGFLVAYLSQYSKIRKLNKQIKTLNSELQEFKDSEEENEDITSEGIKLDDQHNDSFFKD